MSEAIHSGSGSSGSPAGQAGFALMDALLGLLLLGTALLGAGACLLGNLRSSHSTWVQQQAIDLGSDLAESLAIAAGPEAARAAQAEWRAAISRTLPQGALSSSLHASLPFQAPVPLHLLELRLAWPGAARGMPDLALAIAAPGWESAP